VLPPDTSPVALARQTAVASAFLSKGGSIMNLAALVASLKLDASDYFAQMGRAAEATQEMGRDAAETASKLGNTLGAALDTTAAESGKAAEGFKRIPPTLQQVDDALKGLGIRSVTELHALSEEAQKAADVVKRGFDASKASLVEYQLAQRASVEAQIAASRANDSLTGDVKELEAEYRQLTASLRESGITARDSLGLMETKTRDVSAEMQRMGQTLAIGGAALTATITRPILDLAEAAVTLGSKFAMAEVSFTKLLGSGQDAQQFLGELKNFAASTPFEFPDLLSAAQRLKAMGFEATAVIPMLRAVGDQVASMGGSSEQVDRITRALGQMSAKGKVSAEEMMQLAEANVNGWEMVANSIGISIPEAMERSKRGTLSAAEAIPAILEGMAAQTGGQMENMSKTVAGQFSNMKDRITFILADVGKALLPLAGTVLQIAEPILGLIGNIAAGFASLPSPAQAFIVTLGGIAAAVGPIAVAVGGVVSMLGSLAGALGITGGAAALMSAALATLGPVVLGVAAGVAVLVGAWEAWKTDTVQDAIASITASLGTLWNDYISPVTQALYEFGRGVADLAGEFVSAKLEAIWNGLSEAARGFWEANKTLAAGFVDLAKGIYNFIVPAAETAAEKIKELLNWVNQLSGGALGRATSAVGSAFSAMKDIAVDTFNAVRERGKVSTEETQSAMQGLSAALKSAEDNFKSITEKFQSGKATQEQLAAATQRMTDAKRAYSAELSNFKPVIDRAKQAMEDARREYTSSNSALAILNKQVQDGKPVAEQFAAAQQRVKDANENLTQATNNYKSALQQTGQDIKTYDQGIGAIRDSLRGKAEATNTAADATKAHKEMVKAERDEVALASAEFKQAEVNYKAGRISMEELANASRLLQIAQDNLDPSRAAEHQVEANTRMIKSVQDTVKWYEDSYKKIDKFNADIAKSSVDLANKFSKAYEDMVKKAQAPIQITISTSGQLSGKGLAEDMGNTFKEAFSSIVAAARETASDLPGLFDDGLGEIGSLVQDMADTTIAVLASIGTHGKAALDLGAAVSAAIKNTEELADAYRTLGVVTTQSMEDKASKAQAAYQLIKDSGIASANEIKQAHLAALKATADAYKANGDDIPKSIKEAIKQIEAELKGFKDRWDGLWKDMAQGTMDVFRDFTQEVGGTIWDFVLGKGNSEFEKQKAELSSGLGEMSSEWQQFQDEIATKREEAKTDNARNLAEELSDIDSNLAERVGAYESYVAEVNDKLALLREASATELSKEQEKLAAALAERVATYDEYAADVAEKISAAQTENTADLEAATKKLQDSLQDRRDAYDEYVVDVADKASKLRTDMAASLAEEVKDLNDKLLDKRSAYADFAAEIAAKTVESRADNAADLADDLAKLRDSLEDKRSAYDEFVADVADKQGEITAKAAEKLQEDLENLQDNLAKRKDALAKYVQDANRRLSRLGEDSEEAIDDETKDTKRALEDKRIAYERASRDLQDRIDRELAKGSKANMESVADWKKSLAEKNEDYQKSITRLEEDLAEFVDDNKKRLDRETNDIKRELSDREQDYADYVDEVTRKQAELTEASQKEVSRQLQELQANLQRRTQEWQKYQADNAAAIVKTTEEHATAQAKEEVALQASLAKRRIELDKFEADTITKIATTAQEKNAKLVEEETALNKSLEKKRIELDKFEADTITKQADLVVKYAAELEKEVAALKKSLEDKKKELDKYEADIATKQEALTVKYAEELAKDEATLLTSLDKKRAELEKYKADAALKAEKLREKYAEELAKEELALTTSLAKKQTEFDRYAAQQAAKLAELEAKHKGFWETIGEVGKTSLEMLGRKLTEVGIDDLVDQLSEVLLPRLKNVFESVFEGIGGTIKSLVQGDLGSFGRFFTESIPGFLGDAVGKFGSFFSTVAGGIADFVGDHLSKISGWFVKLATEILPDAIASLAGFFAKIGGWITDLVGSGASSAGSAAVTAGGAAATTAAVNAGASSAASGVASGAAGIGSSSAAGALSGGIAAVGSIVGALLNAWILGADTGKTEENTRGTLEQLRALQASANQYWPKLQDLMEYMYRNQLPALAGITDEIVDKLGVVSRILGFDTRTWLYEIRDAVQDVNTSLTGSVFTDIRQAAMETNGKLDTLQIQLDSIYNALGGKAGDPVAAITSLAAPITDIKIRSQQTADGFVSLLGAVGELDSSLATLDYSAELTTGFSSVNSALQGLNLQSTISSALQTTGNQLNTTVQNLNIPAIVNAVIAMGNNLQNSINAMDLRGSITSLLSAYSNSVTNSLNSQYSALSSLVSSRPPTTNIINVQAIAPTSTSPMAYASQVGNLLTNAIK